MASHSLRHMIDGGMQFATGSPIAKPQPDPTIRQQAMDPKPGTNKLKDTSKQQGASMAKTVSENLQDPLGTTQEGFDELNEKQMEYELAKQKMARNLAPVKSVIQHVEQMHDMNQNGIPDELEPGMADQAMGYHGPNVGDRSRLGMGPMAQQPGRMQMNKPGQAVSYPGAGPKIPGAPARQANPEAPVAKAAPKGQVAPAGKQMKPGKQAGKGISVSVKASDAIARGVSDRIRSTFAAANLANMSCCDMTKPLQVGGVKKATVTPEVGAGNSKKHRGY